MRMFGISAVGWDIRRKRKMGLVGVGDAERWNEHRECDYFVFHRFWAFFTFA